MGREILITGGAGYIGSHTVLAIMEQTDWTPVSIDNLSNSEIDVYDRIADISGVQVKHYEVDITDEKALGRVFSEHSFEGIMHFAAWKFESCWLPQGHRGGLERKYSSNPSDFLPKFTIVNLAFVVTCFQQGVCC